MPLHSRYIILQYINIYNTDAPGLVTYLTYSCHELLKYALQCHGDAWHGKRTDYRVCCCSSFHNTAVLKGKEWKSTRLVSWFMEL